MTCQFLLDKVYGTFWATGFYARNSVHMSQVRNSFECAAFLFVLEIRMKLRVMAEEVPKSTLCLCATQARRLWAEGLRNPEWLSPAF